MKAGAAKDRRCGRPALRIKGRKGAVMARQDFDLHMHTYYCDGRDSAEDMVKAAIGKGLRTVGISGHSFTPHDPSYCMSRADTLRYIEEINALKAKYAGRIRVLLGIELDYYSDTDTSPFDYIIGSVHYLFKEPDYAAALKSGASGASGAERGGVAQADPSKAGAAGATQSNFEHAGTAQGDPAQSGASRSFAAGVMHGGEAQADASKAVATGTAQSDPALSGAGLTKYCDWIDVDSEPGDIPAFAENNGMSLQDAAALYYEAAGSVIAQTGCDIVGHFDLITKFNEKEPRYDTSDPLYISAWKRAIDRIFEDCRERYKCGHKNRLETLGLLEAGDKPVFEINTGAISRGYRTGPYPAPDQIRYIRDMGGLFILSSDSHSVSTLCYGFEEYGRFL